MSKGKLIVLEGIDGSGKSAQYRRICARMEKDGPFCCEACRKRAERYRENEKRRRQASEPLNRVLREKEDYNRQHGTAYSYGQYVALCEISTRRRKGEKKCMKTKRIT